MNVTYFKSGTRTKGGRKGEVVDLYNLLKRAETGIEFTQNKEDLPVIQAHDCGIRFNTGEYAIPMDYSSNGLVLFDIDAIGGKKKEEFDNATLYAENNKLYVDAWLQFITENESELPFIKYVTISKSNNLHLYCVADGFWSRFEYKFAYKALYKIISETISSLLEFSDLPKPDIDYHNANPLQLLYINTSPLYTFNDNVSFDYNTSSLSALFDSSVDEILGIKSVEQEDEDNDLFVAELSKSDGLKLDLSRNGTCICGLKGNDLRRNIAPVLFSLFNGDKELCKEWCILHIENKCKETISWLKSCNNKFKPHPGIRNYLIYNCDDFISLREKLEERYKADNEKLNNNTQAYSDLLSEDAITLNNDEYLNNYYSKITEHDKCFIIAPCGCGKSTYIENLYNNGECSSVLVAWNSIKNGAFKEIPSTCIYNFFHLKENPTLIETLNNSSICIDEIHLISSESDYRVKEIDGLQQVIKNCNCAKVFTGTPSRPMIEYFKSLGYYILEFKKEEKPVILKKVIVPSGKVKEYLQKWYFPIEGYEASIYVSNRFKAYSDELDYTYICRDNFNSCPHITSLCSKNGHFKGNYCSTSYISVGIDNNLNTGIVRLAVRNAEFNSTQVKQLANRFRKAQYVEITVITEKDNNGTEIEYLYNQSNFKSEINNLFTKELMYFTEHQLKDLSFTSVREYSDFELAADEKHTNKINKGLRNYAIEHPYTTFMYTPKPMYYLNDEQDVEQVFNPFEDELQLGEIERKDCSEHFLVNNKTFTDQVTDAVTYSNGDLELYKWYLNDANSIDEILHSIRFYSNYNTLTLWEYERYGTDWDIDWENVDTTIKKTKFVKSDVQVFSLNAEYARCITSNDKYKAIFIQTTKGRLWEKKKLWELGHQWYTDHKSLFTETIDGNKIKKSNTEIVGVIYNESGPFVKPEYNDSIQYEIMIGKTISLPLVNTKLSKYKYKLIDGDLMFSKLEEAYDEISKTKDIGTLSSFKKHKSLWSKYLTKL